MWPEAVNFKWEELSIPGTTATKQIIYYGNSLFAMGPGALFKSLDNGQSWKQLAIPYSETKDLSSMDIDQGQIYIACRNGILVSENLDGNFSWSFNWDWDGTLSVDFENGHGWATVANWGSMSGIIKTTPDGYWERVNGNYTWDNYGEIKADPFDPANAAFFENKTTLDGGAHWNTLQCTKYADCRVSFASTWNHKSIFFSGSKYSQDRGITWNSLGIYASTGTKAGDVFFIEGIDDVNYYDSIYTGTPNNWTRLGLNFPGGYHIAATDSMVFTASNGKIYRGTWQK